MARIEQWPWPARKGIKALGYLLLTGACGFTIFMAMDSFIPFIEPGPMRDVGCVLVGFMTLVYLALYALAAMISIDERKYARLAYVIIACTATTVLSWSMFGWYYELIFDWYAMMFRNGF